MASTQAVSGYAEIVRNTVSGILRSKVLYIILFLTIIIAAVSILPILYFQMASEAGEIDTAISLTSQTMGSIIGLWTTATYMLALFLGATAISSEVKTKTIVTVLSKPVDRWKFLLAKWVGIQAFLLFFFLAYRAQSKLSLIKHLESHLKKSRETEIAANNTSEHIP